MRYILTIFMSLLTYMMTDADAHTLHIGDTVFRLDSVKRTTPALCVAIGDDTLYGALYSGAAPEQTAHIGYGDGYWLGQNCVAGMYSETGVSACADCGIGHYCTGGMARTSCTYGAISCNGANHATDAQVPNGAPINKFMTLDEVNEFVPPTDFSDWRLVSACNNQLNSNYQKPDTVNDVSNACAHGTIGPGTYLFVKYYENGGTDVNSITGMPGSITDTFIAVFDHAVGYAIMHGGCIFQHFVDTEHPIYTKWTIHTGTEQPMTACRWYYNKNQTNVSNLINLPYETMLHIYELK